MFVQEPVQAAIRHCLHQFSYSNATFLAERLFAEVSNDDALYLLARCYYLSGQTGQAYHCLRNYGRRLTPEAKFMLAKCSLDLNRLSEAESVITDSRSPKPKSNEDIISEFGDVACFVFELLGIIYARTARNDRARECYTLSVKLNPFLFESFASACKLGDKKEKLDPAQYFQTSGLENFSMCHGQNPVMNMLMERHNEASTDSITETLNTQNIQNSTPLMSSCLSVSQMSNTSNTLLSRMTPQTTQTMVTPDFDINSPDFPVAPNKLNRKQQLFLTPYTPGFGHLSFDSPSIGDISQLSGIAFLSPLPLNTSYPESNKKILRKEVFGKSSVFNPQSSNAVNVTPGIPHSTPSPLQPPGQNVRRSSRLFSSGNSVKENSKTPKSRLSTAKSPSRKQKSRSVKTITQSNYSALNEKNNNSDKLDKSDLGPYKKRSNQNIAQTAFALQKQSADGLMSLLRHLGIACQQVATYTCKDAIENLTSLPPQHYNTSWVKCLLARAYFELAKYAKAAELYAEVQRKEPYRSSDMEYFSTALWHLQSEVALSTLARDLTTLCRDTPQAWCAAGNCFSLQKEHEMAIKFFQRAVQIDPQFAYAYTLLGHEYVATEELEKAMSCFQNAVRIDSEHYNAWYGIGMIYFKQERFPHAEAYFRKAVLVNPHSAPLMCHVAVVQQAQQKTDMALETLDKALREEPQNPLCKFHRASVLFTRDRTREALVELENLKSIVPKESLVYFLMGKVHKREGNTHLALMNFSWAMDLDPKGANQQIKEGIDPTVRDNEYLSKVIKPIDHVLDDNNEEEETDASSRTVEVGEELSEEGLDDFIGLQNMESDESL